VRVVLGHDAAEFEHGLRDALEDLPRAEVQVAHSIAHIEGDYVVERFVGTLVERPLPEVRRVEDRPHPMLTDSPAYD
jgi:hypothetical protein